MVDVVTFQDCARPNGVTPNGGVEEYLVLWIALAVSSTRGTVP